MSKMFTMLGAGMGAELAGRDRVAETSRREAEQALEMMVNPSRHRYIKQYPRLLDPSTTWQAFHHPVVIPYSISHHLHSSKKAKLIPSRVRPMQS